MPTAAIISGGLGAGSNLISGLLQSNAAQTASQQQTAALQQALQQVQQIYGQGNNTIQNLYNQGAGVLRPIIQQGQGIVNNVSPLISKLLQGGPTAVKALSGTPGFQFSNMWGQNAIANQASTTGLGGNQLAAGANYAEGLAGNTYSNVLGAAQNYMNSGNQLVSAGASPFGSLTGGTIGTTGTLTGQLAGSIGGLLSSIGQSQAQGTLGSANAFSTALTGGTGSVSNAALLYGLTSKLQANQDQAQDNAQDSGAGASNAAYSPVGIYT